MSAVQEAKKSDDRKIGEIELFSKKLPIYERGEGEIPLLVIGPANLFRKKGMIPEQMNSRFKIYFVDFFEKQGDELIDLSKVTLGDFIDSIEAIRNHLSLEKIALFAHSSSGVLAVEYAKKYQERVLLNILVSSSPVWGGALREDSDEFFKGNASQERRDLYQKDQEELLTPEQKEPSFTRRYLSRKARFFYGLNSALSKNLWENISIDEPMVNHYFSLIQTYKLEFSQSLATVKTFIALGLYDYSAPVDLCLRYAQCFVERMCCVFSESAHFPMIEESSEFVSKLFDYINSIQLKK
jgi:proline iminopeptidase